MLYFFNTKPMESNTIDLTWLCFITLIVIIGLVAVLSTRSRLKYAKRIMDAQRKGAFKDMDNPNQRSRFRWLALIALIGLIGTMCSLTGLILLKFAMLQIPAGVILVLFAVFGTISVIGGFLMHREIDRRL